MLERHYILAGHGGSTLQTVWNFADYSIYCKEIETVTHIHQSGININKIARP